MDVRAAPYITYDWRYIHVDVSVNLSKMYYALILKDHKIKQVVANPFVERAEFSDYIAIISAFLVLAFFGFSSESLSYYAKLLSFLGIRWRHSSSRSADGHQHSPHRTVM